MPEAQEDAVVKVGGPYKESDDHVPNPTDMYATYNTSGVGASHNINAVSPIFEIDRKQVAAEALAALDPDDATVSADRVLLPENATDNDTARESLTKAARAALEEPVVVGEPATYDPAVAEAEVEGDEGARLAAEQEADNASQTGAATTGTPAHDAQAEPVKDEPAKADEKDEEKKAAKKTAAKRS